MIDPKVTPKHDHTPATNLTAYQNADAISQNTFNELLKLKTRIEVADYMRKVTFNACVDAGAHLQNFMNARIDKMDR